MNERSNIFLCSVEFHRGILYTKWKEKSDLFIIKKNNNFNNNKTRHFYLLNAISAVAATPNGKETSNAIRYNIHHEYAAHIGIILFVSNSMTFANLLSFLRHMNQCKGSHLTSHCCLSFSHLVYIFINLICSVASMKVTSRRSRFRISSC